MASGMLDLLNNQAPGGAVDNTPPPMGSADATPPMATGMTTPQPQAGAREAALINIHMAMDLMEKALGGLGAESPEGGIVMKSLGSLTKVFGEQGRSNTAELAPAEILQLLNQLPQAGGASPEQQTVQNQPAVPGMAGGASMNPSMGPPGGGMPQNAGQP